MNIKNQIESSWKAVLSKELETPYFLKLEEQLKKEQEKHTIYPPKQEIFSAYNLTPISQIKVVIIGQDPYHGESQANGLCFSVTKGIKHPPSLKNILRELSQNYNLPAQQNGDLSLWAKQGVLLLNATLTVRSGEANSHKDLGWQQFTDATIKAISDNCNNIIFLLWGGFAKKKAKLINEDNHFILTGGHPSPLSANRGYWFGNNHFVKTNKILNSIGVKEINWKLD